MVKKYDMNWKFVICWGMPRYTRATHSIHSPGDHDTKARVVHRGDSVSSPNACGKEPTVANARFSALLHEFASQHITLNWLETHNTAYLLGGGIVDAG
jgi:hypothetical protein